MLEVEIFFFSFRELVRVEAVKKEGNSWLYLLGWRSTLGVCAAVRTTMQVA